MSPANRVPAALSMIASAAVLLSPFACSSSQKTAASGGAHFEIVSFPTADPTLKCDDIGVQKDIATVDKKLIVDGADGAVVNCSFGSDHFSVQIIDPSGDSVQASGSIQAGTSKDASITIGFLGSSYSNPTATKCTVTFVCPNPPCDAGSTFPNGNSIQGHFLCTEVDNSRTAKECAITGANPAGLSNSYFKFNDCN